MSGYQIFNSAGALVIDSNYFGTYFRDSKSYTVNGPLGDFNISAPVGNTTDMGYVDIPYTVDSDLQWFKFNNGAKSIFCGGVAPLMTRSPGVMARTGSDVPIESGYKDVYNASGKLIWSAVAAAKIPRIMGFFDIPAGYDLDSQVYSQYIGTDTWILASYCPGYLDYSDDGGANATNYAGLFFRYSAGTLYASWIGLNGSKWSQTLSPYGLRIPYAILPNLN